MGVALVLGGLGFALPNATASCTAANGPSEAADCADAGCQAAGADGVECGERVGAACAVAGYDCGPEPEDP